MDETKQTPEDITPNFDLLADLVRRCIGTRGIGEYSELSGISRSWLSKILNQKSEFPPSRRIIARLYDTRYDADITMDMLLEASGKDIVSGVIHAQVANRIRQLCSEKDLHIAISIFLFLLREAEKLGDSFQVSYHDNEYVVTTDNAKFICLPALLFNQSDLVDQTMAEVIMKILKRETGGSEDDANIEYYILTDHPTVATKMKQMIENIKHSVKVFYTDDYLTADPQ